MASSIIELYVDVPADRQANIFGQFDEHLKLIERTLNVTMIFQGWLSEDPGKPGGSHTGESDRGRAEYSCRQRQYHYTAECELRTFPCNGEDRFRDGRDRQGLYL